MEMLPKVQRSLFMFFYHTENIDNMTQLGKTHIAQNLCNNRRIVEELYK